MHVFRSVFTRVEQTVRWTLMAAHTGTNSSSRLVAGWLSFCVMLLFVGLLSVCLIAISKVGWSVTDGLPRKCWLRCTKYPQHDASPHSRTDISTYDYVRMHVEQSLKLIMSKCLQDYASITQVVGSDDITGWLHRPRFKKLPPMICKCCIHMYSSYPNRLPGLYHQKQQCKPVNNLVTRLLFERPTLIKSKIAHSGCCQPLKSWGFVASEPEYCCFSHQQAFIHSQTTSMSHTVLLSGGSSLYLLTSLCLLTNTFNAASASTTQM